MEKKNAILEEEIALVTGPTASMLPEPFFQRGVTMLGGIVSTDADRMLDLISEGGSGYHIFGTCAYQSILISASEPL